MRAVSLTLEGEQKPDMASLTLGSLNFSTEASISDPATVMRLAAIMKERGIRPELEVFDLGMVNFAKVLIDKGLIEPPFYFNILLGNPGSAQASLLHLGTWWRTCRPSRSGPSRYRRHQALANGLGVVVGHGVRTGLETISGSTTRAPAGHQPATGGTDRSPGGGAGESSGEPGSGARPLGLVARS